MIYSCLIQLITLGVFYMLVPLANALLHMRTNSKVPHIIVGAVYAFGGLCLSPISYLFVLLSTAEGTGMPYMWRLYTFGVPYVICYLVGIAQLIYDIFRKSTRQTKCLSCIFF